MWFENQKPWWVTQIMLKSCLYKEVCQKANVPTDGPSGYSWVAPECCKGSQTKGQVWERRGEHEPKTRILPSTKVHLPKAVPRIGHLRTPEPFKSPTPDKEEQRESANQAGVTLKSDCRKQYCIKIKVHKLTPHPWIKTKLHEKSVSDEGDAEEWGYLKNKKKGDPGENL